MVKEIKLSRIVLKVNDLEKMKTFYQGLFKMHIVQQTANRIQFSFTEGGNIVLELDVQQPNITKEPFTGLYHFAFLFEKEVEMASLVVHLLRNGYPLSGAADHLVSHAVYLQDPEGNDIELYADMPEDTWIWKDGQVVMDTLELDMQDQFDKSRPWDGFSTDVTIGHMHFYGADLDKGEKFFTEILMMDKVSELGEMAQFYSLNGYHHHVAMNGWKPSQELSEREELLGLSEWEIEVSPAYYEAIISNLKTYQIDYEERPEHIISVKDALQIPLIVRKQK